MTSIDELLKEMDDYDWDSVDDYDLKWSSNYISLVSTKWQEELDVHNIKLEGKLLDVCCGPVSMGHLYKDTIGIDKSPKCIKSVRAWGYDGIIGDLRKMPFDDKQFQKTVCFYPPFRPYSKTLKPSPTNTARYVDIVLSEMMRVTEDEIFLIHSGFVDYAPAKFDKYVKKKEGFFLHYKM